jgi:hypothetical protein
MYSVMVNVVRVCGTDSYSKEWACDSADCYSVVVKVVSVCELTGTLKSGLVAVQIVTALLLKVNIFSYLM